MKITDILIEDVELTPGSKQGLDVDVEIPETVTSILDIIDRECSDYIGVASKILSNRMSYLYRGVSNESRSAFIGRSRENRTPADSTKFFQEAFDILLDDWGFEAKRSNSIFCSTSPGHASSFGEIYYIFPKNGFKFLYTSVNDIVLSFDFFDKYMNIGACRQYLKLLQDWTETYYTNALTFDERDSHEYATFFNLINPTSNSIPANWGSKPETRILSHMFHAMLDSEFPSNIPHELDIRHNVHKFIELLDVAAFKRYIKPMNSNLDTYLRRRKGEIHINGIYYALRKQDFEKYVHAYFSKYFNKESKKINS